MKDTGEVELSLSVMVCVMQWGGIIRVCDCCNSCTLEYVQAVADVVVCHVSSTTRRSMMWQTKHCTTWFVNSTAAVATILHSFL